MFLILANTDGRLRHKILEILFVELHMKAAN